MPSSPSETEQPLHFACDGIYASEQMLLEVINELEDGRTISAHRKVALVRTELDHILFKLREKALREEGDYGKPTS